MNKEIFLKKSKKILGQKSKDSTNDLVLLKLLDLFVPGRTSNYSEVNLFTFQRKLSKLPEHDNAFKIIQLSLMEAKKICTYSGFELHINETTGKFVNYLLVETDKLLKIHEKYEIIFEEETENLKKIKKILDELYFTKSNSIILQRLTELKNIYLSLDKDGFSYDIFSRMTIWTFTHFYQKTKFNFIFKSKISAISKEIFKNTDAVDTFETRLTSNAALI